MKSPEMRFTKSGRRFDPLAMDISSMKSMNAWLSEVLHEEAIGIAEWSSDGLKIDKDSAYRCYFDWCKNQREYRAHAKNSWVIEIKKIFGLLVDTDYRELRDAPGYLKFATLETCRAAFQIYAGSPAKLGGADTLAQLRTALRPDQSVTSAPQSASSIA